MKQFVETRQKLKQNEELVRSTYFIITISGYFITNI